MSCLLIGTVTDLALVMEEHRAAHLDVRPGAEAKFALGAALVVILVVSLGLWWGIWSAAWSLVSALW